MVKTLLKTDKFYLWETACGDDVYATTNYHQMSMDIVNALIKELVNIILNLGYHINTTPIIGNINGHMEIRFRCLK